MTPIRVELTTDMFEALGSYWPDTSKALSPLQRSVPPSPTIDEKVIQAGILDPGKKVAQSFDCLLASLATSTPAPPRVASMPAPIRETTVPASKKKIPRKLIVGFAVTMVLACLLVLAGAALVILIQMK
jgi:hypothetical protein